MDSSRKKTGGKIEIQVNLRKPLTGEDIVKRSERWLVLDSFGSTASQCMSLAGLTVGGPYTSPNTPHLENLSMAGSPAPVNSPAVVNSPVPQAEVPEKATNKPTDSAPSKPVSSPDTKMTNTELEQAEEEFDR